jgi:hypothetical protein
VEQELATLAMTGATTVVAAMATGAWESTRDGVARLFHRHGQEQVQAIAAQLDGDAAMVERAADQGEAREGLAGGWRLRLAELLREHPEAAAELRAQIEAVARQLPQAVESYTQYNDRGATGFQVKGTVNVNRPPAGTQA